MTIEIAVPVLRSMRGWIMNGGANNGSRSSETVVRRAATPYVRRPTDSGSRGGSIGAAALPAPPITVLFALLVMSTSGFAGGGAGVVEGA